MKKKKPIKYNKMAFALFVIIIVIFISMFFIFDLNLSNTGKAYTSLTPLPEAPPYSEVGFRDFGIEWGANPASTDSLTFDINGKILPFIVKNGELVLDD